MNSRLRLLAPFAVVATISLLAAACGGDDPTPTPQPPVATATATATSAPTATPTPTQIPPAPTATPTATSAPGLPPTPTPTTPSGPPTVPPFVPTPTAPAPTAAPTPTTGPAPTATATAVPTATPTTAPTTPPVAPVTVTLLASKDATLYESTSGNKAAGSDAGIFVGVNGLGEKLRALELFDVAASVPAGATVTNVTLELRMNKTLAQETPVTVHRLEASWGEGSSTGTLGRGGGGAGGAAQSNDATWQHRFFNTQNWAIPGGDFSSAVSASTGVGGSGTHSWAATSALIADVQGWLDDTSSNHGWLLKGDESRSRTAKRFASRETVTNAPILTVEYTPAG